MRCAVYVRVSTNKEEQKGSLVNQKDLFLDFIAKQGWTLYDIYIDVETGTTDKRPNFQRMVEDAENRKFDCILAKELSRIARNGELAYKIKRVLEDSKIHFITLDGAINTLEGNRDKFGLFAWLYEEESQRTSKRIRMALRQKALNGEFKGSNAPYGYYVENKRLIKRDDETVDAVKTIFSLYLRGMGVEAIAKVLNEKGYPTPSRVAGKKNAGEFWHGSSVLKILKNPHYVGDLVQGRSQVASVTNKKRHEVPEDEWIVVPNTHEPIISREDFDAVQRLLWDRYVPRPKAKKHLFTNYVFCADCGSSLWYLHNRKGYVCGRFKKHGLRACTSHSIKEDALKEQILWDLRDMAKLVVDKNLFLKRFESHWKKEQQDRQKKMVGIQRKIESLQNENKKFLKLLAQEVISQEEYRAVVDENQREIQVLQEQLTEIKGILESHSSNVLMAQRVMSELDRILEFEDLTEELLHRLVKRIEVTDDHRAIVYYRFADPFALMA
ncbi:recombinase family protein [Effusibacillus pohliae]|uniref:recombinase family protein n=1 Tax=Effusibacillus pohliae TaxID=232270 RepID=UPI00036F7D00|nr:recombinase family protein [Effusibacillus pohliae]